MRRSVDRRVVAAVLVIAGGGLLAGQVYADATFVMQVEYSPAVPLSAALDQLTSNQVIVHGVTFIETIESNDANTTTRDIRIDPPFQFEDDPVPIVDLYWRERWADQAALQEMLDDPETPQPYRERLALKVTALELAMGASHSCWDTHSCPMPLASFALVEGTIPQLYDLLSLPEVGAVNFSNGRMTVTGTTYATPPQTSMGTPEALPTYIDAVAYSVFGRKWEPPHSRAIRAKELRPRDMAAIDAANRPNPAHGTDDSWVPAFTGIRLRRLPAGLPLEQDQTREFTIPMQWSSITPNLFQDQPSEEPMNYEQKLIFNDAGVKYNPGTYAKIGPADIIAAYCIPPLIPLIPPVPVCVPNPHFGVPYVSASCDLPGCYKDTPLLDSLPVFGWGSANPEAIDSGDVTTAGMPYHMIVRFGRGTINGSGGQDLDNGCVQPQLHFKAFGVGGNPDSASIALEAACHSRPWWGCTGNTHEVKHITGAQSGGPSGRGSLAADCGSGSAPAAMFRLDPIPNPAPPPSSWVWHVFNLHGDVTTCNWPGCG